MTISRSDLKIYLDLQLQRNSLMEEIKASYDTYHSPAFNSESNHAGGPSDPTAAALNKISRAEQKINEINERLEEISNQVLDIQDLKTQAVIRYRYICGYQWKGVAIRMGMSVRTVQDIENKYFCA